jgi:hypothetical protein
MNRYPLIRTIYLYLFTIIGLALLTIGGVRFVDMGLRAFIFTQADEEQRLSYLQPPVYYPVGNIEKLTGNATLSDQEKTQITQLLQDYKTWQESRAKIDPVTAKRQRDTSINLALILIGLPLYLYHWRTIGKEMKNRES